jgi:uncharacterized protein YacL
MKRTVNASLICAIIFGIAATWLGPKMIAYYYAPPVPTAFACNESVSWAMHKLVLTQLIGTAIGLVVGLVIGVLMRGKKPSVTQATPPAAGV